MYIKFIVLFYYLVSKTMGNNDISVNKPSDIQAQVIQYSIRLYIKLGKNCVENYKKYDLFKCRVSAKTLRLFLLFLNNHIQQNCNLSFSVYVILILIF